MNRPYLILPHLINQPTWGGNYISIQKGLRATQKIGQSYELSKQSRLSTTSRSTRDLLSQLNSPEGVTDSIPITEFEQAPLLIKLNQARGNSFQLHVKPDEQNSPWKPKPESWFFLEDGYISLGIKPNINIDEYKKVCIEIDDFMRSISHDVIKGNITLQIARDSSTKFVHEKNPWQFVNVCQVKKHTVVDLSMGGVHHSWEDDGGVVGNIVFEVQLEASDDESTIRAFDQGKIKDDGTVRPLQIKDYFTHLDTRPEVNDVSLLTKRDKQSPLVSSPYYTVEECAITEKIVLTKDERYVHIFVREGEVEVSAGGVDILVGKAQSCFLPGGSGDFEVSPSSPSAAILITQPTK